jgi:hypothetical protein
MNIQQETKHLPRSKKKEVRFNDVVLYAGASCEPENTIPRGIDEGQLSQRLKDSLELRDFGDFQHGHKKRMWDSEGSRAPKDISPPICPKRKISMDTLKTRSFPSDGPERNGISNR